jgi:hypothetical protein
LPTLAARLRLHLSRRTDLLILADRLCLPLSLGRADRGRLPAVPASDSRRLSRSAGAFLTVLAQSPEQIFAADLTARRANAFAALGRARLFTRRAALVFQPIAIVVDPVTADIQRAFRRKLTPEAGVAVLVFIIRDAITIIVDPIPAHLWDALGSRRAGIAVLVEETIAIIIQAITGGVIGEHGKSVARRPCASFALLVPLMAPVIAGLGLSRCAIDVHAEIVLADRQTVLERIRAALSVGDAAALPLAGAIGKTGVALRTIRRDLTAAPA